MTSAQVDDNQMLYWQHQLGKRLTDMAKEWNVMVFGPGTTNDTHFVNARSLLWEVRYCLLWLLLLLVAVMHPMHTASM